jgi:A1 cistron-splicing factor AAR2
VSFLDSTFFSTHLPSLESHLLESLTVLSTSLSDALPSWVALAHDDSNIAGVWKEVIKRWDALAAVTSEKFGWDLGVIKGSRAGYATAAPGQGRTWKEYDEMDFEELEEGEDAPVIVDEEGLYINSEEY